MNFLKLVGSFCHYEVKTYGDLSESHGEAFEIAVRSDIYVDKTGMLIYLNSVLGKEQRFVCVSRPRRFGKSSCKWIRKS